MMRSDIEIAQSAALKPINEVAAELGIESEHLELYGKYKAKFSLELTNQARDGKDGNLILVTAINPTPAGEGKTTMTVGLGQAFGRIGKKAVIALREPSLGPTFGLKGGAAGGGYSQVVPMEDINMHFTGDMHGVTAANNLLCAMADNHIHQGNSLGLDPKRIMIKRVLDLNDRALRNTVIGMGGKADGVVREDHFMITVASEVMAILCLSAGILDLKEKLAGIIVGYKYNGDIVYAGDLKAEGAMAALLRDAIKPNLVQTLENTPCIIHGGPFANIAHGCNSVAATGLALKLADYVITEAGFGADLGAEKFFDIKCRKGGFKPSAAVIVATVRALKYNGGMPREQLGNESVKMLEKGICNLGKHIENINKFGVPAVVAINHFYKDTPAEINAIKEYCAKRGVKAVTSYAFEKGGDGARELADTLIQVIREERSEFRPLYELEAPVKDKISKIVTEIYGGSGVIYESKAEKAIEELESRGFGALPICMAKTQYSLSDDPKKLGRPENFTITVRDVYVNAGAGFITVLTGKILTMPGLPKTPAAEAVDVKEDGTIIGLF